MKPIAFVCRETLSSSPNEIAAQILDLARWPEFQGYGVLPGIKSASFERQTPEVVGTRIRVTNTDGSSHVEEIVEWQPEQRIQLRMSDFSPPLSRLAREFRETWEFSRGPEGTRIARSFEMDARTMLAWPALWLISFLLKGAIASHLRLLRRHEEGAKA